MVMVLMVSVMMFNEYDVGEHAFHDFEGGGNGVLRMAMGMVMMVVMVRGDADCVWCVVYDDDDGDAGDGVWFMVMVTAYGDDYDCHHVYIHVHVGHVDGHGFRVFFYVDGYCLW